MSVLEIFHSIMISLYLFPKKCAPFKKFEHKQVMTNLYIVLINIFIFMIDYLL